MAGSSPAMTPQIVKTSQNQRRLTMAKVLVLYYSAYGHIEKMANAVAEGAREAAASVDIKRVPELVPLEVAKASHYKLDQPAPVAKIEELANYDAIIVGTGTRFGRMSSQMANFLDQAGAMRAAFSSTSAAPSSWQGTTDSAVIEILFIYQLARNPMQAIACRWWCRSLFRASRGKRRCPESTNS